MVLKYGEINVFHNTETESYKNLILRYIGKETWVEPSSMIIITWDEDKIPIDISNKIVKKYMEFKFGLDLELTSFPSSICINSSKKISIIYEKPLLNLKGNLVLDLKTLFTKNNNFVNKNFVPSYYNFNYLVQESSNKKTALSCVRVKSSEENPIFLLAYETDYLTDSDVYYIINCLFRNQY